LAQRARQMLAGRWARLYGSGKGLAIVAATRRRRGPCLVIVPNAAEAGRIADEVQFFGGDGLEPLAFPDWETLPYDSERLATLYRLPELRGGIVIAAVTTLMQRLPPRSFLEGNTLMLRTGERVDRDALCEPPHTSRSVGYSALRSPSTAVMGRGLMGRFLEGKALGEALVGVLIDGRETGRDPGADHPIGPAALRELQGPLRRLAGTHRVPVAVSK
jgi:hypothetical protein